MSTTFESTSNVSNLGMTTSPAFVHTFESSEYKYAVTHVFLPVELPEMSDYTLGNDFSLARAVCAAAHAYTTHIYGTSEESRWRCITKMLDSLQASVQSERMDKHHVITQLRGMQTGGIPTVALYYIYMLTIYRYSPVFHPPSKCCDYPYEGGELYDVRVIRGISETRCRRENTGVSDMLISMVSCRDAERGVRG